MIESLRVRAACLSIIREVLAAHQVIAITNPAHASFCPLEFIDAAQARAIYLEWMKSHPDAGRENFASAMPAALSDAYPCD